METHLILEDIAKRHLDIDKIMKLDESQRNFINSIFEKLLVEISGNINGYNNITISLLYNTLIEGDYLVTRREKNLNILVD